MTDLELYSFEAFRRHLHDDERPAERATLAMLDGDKLERYILQRRADRPGFAQLSREQTLEMLNITRGEAVTLAAVMNFCVYPQGYFPQLGITAVVAEGVGHSEDICKRIQEETGIESRATILGHVQRGGSPTLRDRVVASQMGYHAVELLRDGKSNRVVVMQGERIVDFDITEALEMPRVFDEKLYKISQDLSR